MESLFTAWPMFHLRVPLGRPVELPDAAAGGIDWRAILTRLAADDELIEGVSLASTQLSGAVANVLADPVANATMTRRSAQSLLRYAIRSTSRPTPFGLFAGTCFGRFDSASKLELSADRPSHTRVDLAWLLALVERWQVEPAILRRLGVTANESARLRGGRVVLETPSTYGLTPGTDGRTSVSIRATRPVLAALGATATGRPVGELCDELMAQFQDAGPRTVFGLIRSLVQQDLLITDLRPPMDGTDPLAHVHARLAGIETARDLSESLSDIRRLCAEYDSVPRGSGTHQLRQLQQAVSKLGATKTALHVDTTVSATVAISRCVAEEAERAITLLWRLSEPRLGMRPLRDWHRCFLERYGIGRLVGVAEALDDTIGLGAPGGYAWPTSEAPEPGQAPPTREQIRRDVTLGRLLHQALSTGADEIALSERDVAELELGEPQQDRLPPSCELFVHLVAEDVTSIDEGDFRLVVSANPGSHRAGASLSRFAYAGPVTEFAELAAATPGAVPDGVPVDLTYATRGPRAANILNIPSFTGRRLAVALPDTERAGRINVSDLAVGATLDELYLMHKPTGRIIEPVSTSMTSPSTQAPNLARFLFELGLEGRRLWEPWSWGQLAVHPVLPRVRFGRTILCPRTWKLDGLRDQLTVAGADRAALVSDWQARWSVPNTVVAVSADQRLLFDLTLPAHVELFAQEMERDARLMVQETADASAPDGWFREGDVVRPVELVIPFVRRADLATSSPLVASSELTAPLPSGPSRLIQPGQDWLYLSIYGSRRGQDELLRHRLRPLLADLDIESWFFIRYSDADGQHLRLRLRGRPDKLLGSVTRQLTEAVKQWRKCDLIGPVRWSDYDPEYERYGGIVALESAHRFFHADSIFALSALDLCADGHFDRHTIAAASALSLVHDFGPPGGIRDPGAVDRPAGACAGWWLEITGTRRELPSEYRKHQSEWRALLNPWANWTELRSRPGGSELVAALEARRPATAAYAAMLRRLGDRCPTPGRRLVGSLLHMTCNRLLGGYPELETLALGVARGAAQDNERTRR